MQNKVVVEERVVGTVEIGTQDVVTLTETEVDVVSVGSVGPQGIQGTTGADGAAVLDDIQSLSLLFTATLT